MSAAQQCTAHLTHPWLLQELARPDGSPTDVDREFVAMYWVAHERMTFYAGPPIDPCLCAGFNLPLIMHALPSCMIHAHT